MSISRFRKQQNVFKGTTSEVCPMIVQLAIGIVFVVGVYVVGTDPGTHEFAKVNNAVASPAEKMSTNPSLESKPLTEPLTASPVIVTEVETPKEEPKPEPVPEPVKIVQLDNESIVWNKLIAAGYTRNQTAGIMGNLMQEHRFKTDDVPGGLGIAQWMGNRRSNLMAKGNYTDINVQADFLIEELRGVENRAHNSIIANDSLENAVYAFQNQFERCNPTYCMGAQRVAYAYEILSRH